MRIALHQGPSPAGDEDAAMAAVRRTLAIGAAAGARLAVMPELFLPGYNVAGMSAQPADGPWIARLRAICAEAGCGLVVGFAEAEGARRFNSAAAISPEGALLAVHRKLQLFGPREARLFERGDSPTTFELDGLRCGLLICYDVEFAAHVADLARAGAALVLCPTANMRPHEAAARLLVPARAAESGVTVAYANYCGREGDLRYTGLSTVAGPDGLPLASAGTGEATLVVDLAEAEAVPAALRSTQAADYVAPGG